MKNRLKRRLQIRFVLLAVAALMILQALIVIFCICRSYRQMTLKADRIIKLTDTAPDSSEIGDARYFKVVCDINSRTFETDLAHTSLVTRKTAIEYAKSVIDKKTDSGYEGSYRYLCRRDKNGIHITFLSRATAIEAYKSNARTLIVISLAGVAVMAALLVAVSGAVVEPLVRNRQKQKEFITAASHELKTPLTVIYADAQLLESEIGDNEWLADIMKQAKYMTGMTNRLVCLARAEEQGGDLVKIRFPISDVAEDVADSYRAVAQGSGKRFETDIHKDLSCFGDEKAIRELMSALLDNAFKYSTEGGSITARLVPEGHGVRFTVENTVSHIDPGQLDRFTERFFRADTSDKVQGFGIGLSVARAVCESHGGRLVVSAPEEHIIRVSATLK